MPVDNLAVPVSVTTPELEQRRVKALEDQAAAQLRGAVASEKTAIALAGISDAGGPKSDRFERVLRACVEGRVATTVEGFLSFARELCDGIDREFPTPQ